MSEMWVLSNITRNLTWLATTRKIWLCISGHHSGFHHSAVVTFDIDGGRKKCLADRVWSLPRFQAIFFFKTRITNKDRYKWMSLPWKVMPWESSYYHWYFWNLLDSKHSRLPSFHANKHPFYWYGIFEMEWGPLVSDNKEKKPNKTKRNDDNNNIKNKKKERERWERETIIRQ